MSTHFRPVPDNPIEGKKKTGRPRKYSSAADRKRAYRRRRGIPARQFRPVGANPIEGKKAASIPLPPDRQCNTCTSIRACPSCLHAWNSYFVAIHQGVRRGQYLTDAPHGCGLLICGGYDGAQLERVSAAHDNAESGRKAKGANFVEHQFNGDFIYRRTNDGPDSDEADVMEYQEQVADARWLKEQQEFDRAYAAGYREPKSRKKR
jgi:hypothetical protein